MDRRLGGTRYVWLVCGIAVLLLDAAGALASRLWDFEYGALAPVSFVLYFCAGVGAGRIGGVLAGGVAGGVTALVDATVGWALAVALGVPGGSPGVTATVVIGFGMVVTGAGLGLIGGALGKAVHWHLVGPPPP